MRGELGISPGLSWLWSLGSSPVNTWINGKVRFSTWSLKFALPEAVRSLISFA